MKAILFTIRKLGLDNKLAKHFILEIAENQLRFEVDDEKTSAEVAHDGGVATAAVCR